MQLSNVFLHLLEFLINGLGFQPNCFLFVCSGENVEDAFLETAKKIYQNIQDGRYCTVFMLVIILCIIFLVLYHKIQIIKPSKNKPSRK